MKLSKLVNSKYINYIQLLSLKYTRVCVLFRLILNYFLCNVFYVFNQMESDIVVCLQTIYICCYMLFKIYYYNFVGYLYQSLLSSCHLQWCVKYCSYLQIYLEATLFSNFKYIFLQVSSLLLFICSLLYMFIL